MALIAGAALIASAALIAGAALAAGCSPGLPRSAAGAPVLKVVTALWPFAQAAEEIGGSKASVQDVVPVGDDPLAFRPGADATKALRQSGLVLLAGAGLQPAVEAAAQEASRSSRTLRVAAATGTSNPYVWLDPAMMPRAVQAIGDAMAAANPAAAPLYRQNVVGLRSEIGSLDMDFSSTLSTCRATILVTPDRAFATMAAHYGLTDLVAASPMTAAGTDDLRSRIKGSTGAAGVIESGADDSGVRQVAAGTGMHLHPVDTLAAGPTTATRGRNTYATRMEQVLGVLSAALECDSGNQ